MKILGFGAAGKGFTPRVKRMDGFTIFFLPEVLSSRGATFVSRKLQCTESGTSGTVHGSQNPKISSGLHQQNQFLR